MAYAGVHLYTAISQKFYKLKFIKALQKRVSNRLNREEKAIRDPVPAGLIE